MDGATSELRPDIEAFVEQMVSQHGYDPDALRKLFAQVQMRPSILRAMSAPATARPWYEFRDRVIDSRRIAAGVRFWAANRASLQRAHQELGVPEEIIVATIGIETLYGRNMGNFKVLDALSTLAFDYPPRAQFFRGELEQYLLLAREAGLDAAATRGSYAGAIGIPQFMPSSYRKYAIDFDGDGRCDLVNSPADAIGSIANYYRTYGWQAGGAVTARVNAGDTETDSLLAAGLRPHIKVGELRKRGMVLLGEVNDDAGAALFSVETESGPQLRLGFNNFYVITRYNRSVNYAMAVDQLANEIRTEYRSLDGESVLVPDDVSTDR